MADLYAKDPENTPVVLDKFGSGNHGYDDGTATDFEKGSVINERFVNGVTGELMTIQNEMGATADPNTYDQIWNELNKFSAADFGDGNIGDYVVVGTSTLNNDAEVNNATVTAGSVLNTNGYKLLVKGTLTIEAGAVIRNNGADGADGADPTFGAAGPGAPSGSVGGGSDGSAGVIANAADAADLPNAGGGSGGAGADGGGSTGGAGGDAQAPPAAAGSWRNAEAARRGWLRGFGATAWLRGGAGGGGGGGSGGVLYGGGGGGGGGVVILWANKLVLDGTIQANGGGGGDGNGIAGGGGGGGGGVVYLVYRRRSGTGTIEVLGGSGGGGGGAAGSAGANGTVVELTF